jgi:hypothetical protein
MCGRELRLSRVGRRGQFKREDGNGSGGGGGGMIWYRIDCNVPRERNVPVPL